MKFALQIKDEDFDKARELLGEAYADKSNLLIFDPSTGEPPAGQFVLIAISNIWLPKYADRISGYISKIEDLKELIETANHLEFGRQEKIKEAGEVEKGSSEIGAEGETEIPSIEKDQTLLAISQEEEVKNFYLEQEKPSFSEEAEKEENSNDFSFEFGEEKREEQGPALSKEEVTGEAEGKEVVAKEKEIEAGELLQEQFGGGTQTQAVAATPPVKIKEVKRLYLSDAAMAYTVGVGLHLKDASKLIVIVDEKIFQKYGDLLDENVYVFKTFREVTESSLQNYVLIITAKDKAQDKEILEYSGNPIVYWEELNRWVEKQK